MSQRNGPRLFRVLWLALLLVALLAGAALAGTAYTGKRVEYVNDGDTLAFVPPIQGSRSVRFLNLDAAEMGGDTQEPYATEARDFLRDLLPQRTDITIQTDVEDFDVYGRVLGHVIRESDDLNTNLALLREGHAVTYVLWPNVAFFEEYRDAQIAARDDGLGFWDPQDPITELPFEHRLRTGGRQPDKYVGDWFSERYVEPADYDEVHVNNRLFFFTEQDALDAGFAPCPTDAGGDYDQACFSPGS